jgi:hypothetical protein
MGLFERLTNVAKNSHSGLYDDIMRQEAFIDNERKKAIANGGTVPIQIAEDGDIDKAKTLALKNAIKPLSFSERLLGRTLTEDTQVTNPETGETTMETVSNYRPGLLTDFSAGMNENYRENFAPENFGNNSSVLGNRKGLAYRLGEGAGSLAKILAGVGGDAFTAGYNGLKEAQQRQSMRVSDKLYRDALSRRGINTEGLGGLVDSNTFNALLQDAQLKDNAAYRKMYYDMQALNQQELMEHRKREADRQARQDAINTDIAYKNLGLKEKELEQKEQEDSKDIQTLNEMEAQLDDFVSTFDLVDNPYRYRIAGGASRLLNTLTPEESNFNAKRTLLFNAIARKLGEEKGVLSDQDIKRIDDALPKLADNKKQKMAKMEATYSLLNIRRGGGGQQIPQSLNVDRNALEAEMKRRGLK